MSRNNRDIMILDNDMELSVQYHGNAQVIVTPFYAYQILYSIAEGKRMDYDIWYTWAKETQDNYTWLVKYARLMADEYAYRYPAFKPLQSLKDKLPIVIISESGLTPFPQKMEDIYKHEDPVEAYRNLFVFDREDCFRWKNRDQPYWV